MAVLVFGDFWIDTVNKRLWREGGEVALKGIPFAVLAHFVENSVDDFAQDRSGRLVTKRELRKTIWPDVHVTDETVRGCISQIRKALGDDPQQVRYIKTHNKEGWRFVAPVVDAGQRREETSRFLQPPDSPYDSQWYVARPHEERELLSCIGFPGRPVVVYGPQGSGKSTLVTHALETANAPQHGEQAARVLRISLRTLSEAHLSSLDTMLHELGRRMIDPEQEDDERVREVIANLWSRKIEPQLKLKRLVRTHLLVGGHVVYLVLTDVDSLASWPHQAAFFDMLRAWQDADGLSSLHLVIESSIPPRLFPLSEHSPFWTKAARISAAELGETQVAEMAKLYGLEPSVAACRELKEWVGGLASLCRQSMFRAAVQGISLEALLRQSEARDYGTGLFSEHLHDLQQWLEQRDRSGQMHAERKNPLQWLRGARDGVALTTEEAWPFIRKGLLRETEARGVYRLRCQLYEEWLLGRLS